MTELAYVGASSLTKNQRLRIKELEQECFSHVSKSEIRECFIAKEFAWVFAKEGNSIVGQVGLFQRNVIFEGRSIRLGGLGGTCVVGSARHKGLGSMLVKKALEVLRERKCEVACLNANIRDYPSGGLYHRLGFKVMNRLISFTDFYGMSRTDTGEMFAPICSKELFDLVMNSKITFHMGNGYW